MTESPVGSGASKKFQKYPENDFFFGGGGGYTRLIQSYVLLLLECESTCGVLPFCKKTHVQEKSGSWYIPKTSTPMRMHDLYTSELYTISHEVEAGSWIYLCGYTSIEATNLGSHSKWVWSSMSAHAQSCAEWWVNVISRMSWALKFVLSCE